MRRLVPEIKTLVVASVTEIKKHNGIIT